MRLLLGAGVVAVAAVAVWVRLAGTRPQDVADEGLYPLPMDPYLFEMVHRAFDVTPEQTGLKAIHRVMTETFPDELKGPTPPSFHDLWVEEMAGRHHQ